MCGAAKRGMEGGGGDTLHPHRATYRPRTLSHIVHLAKFTRPISNNKTFLNNVLTIFFSLWLYVHTYKYLLLLERHGKLRGVNLLVIMSRCGVRQAGNHAVGSRMGPAKIDPPISYFCRYRPLLLCFLSIMPFHLGK